MIHFKHICDTFLKLEKSSIKADEECETALKSFQPLFATFKSLVSDTLKLTTALKKTHTTADGFITNSALIGLLTNSDYKGVKLSGLIRGSSLY